MKSSAQRRRSKAQIKDDKAREEQRKVEIQAKLLAYNQMERQLDAANAQNKELEQVNSMVHQMFEEGVIKQNDGGSFEAVVDPNERSFIQSKRRELREQSEAS